MVFAPAQVLILEDDPETLQRLTVAVQAAGLIAVPTASTVKAIRYLRPASAEGRRIAAEHPKPIDSIARPVIAVIDWDMSKAHEGGRTSYDVLSELWQWHRGCVAIVYSANIDHANVRDSANRAHARVTFQDKRDGEKALIERIDRILEKKVGDLVIEEGSVHHIPTKERFHHAEAVRLLVQYPESITVEESAARAVRRFASWLEQVGSGVSVLSKGSKKYVLDA